MRPGIVQIHLLNLQALAEDRGSCLSAEEVFRAARFKFREDAERWITCRVRLREILGKAIGRPPSEVPLVRAEFGKPHLAPPFDALYFNVAHAGPVALLALCRDGPVGVDLEPHRKASALVGCETTFCHPAEIAGLPIDLAERASQLLSIWKAKEAVLKAIGTGFSHPPENVRIIFEPPGGHAVSEKALPGIENQRLHHLTHPQLVDHQAVLSTPTNVSSIEYF